MKKLSLLISFIVVINLNATTMDELFKALKQQPATKIDELSSKMANIAEDKTKAGYYPEANMFANYTHYNSATNLRPLDPLAAAKLIAKNEPLPFSNTIEQIGVGVHIPVFVKELGDLSKKAKYLAKSARLKKELNFYQQEALVLGANASLEYLENLVLTLKKTKKSLQKTRDDLEISVNSGRMPGISLDKIDEKINQLDININNLFIKKATLVSAIENLTGLEIKKPAKMHLVTDVQKGEIFALKPLQEIINASNSDFEASFAKRYYPKVSFDLMWSENYAQDDVLYGQSVHRGYGYYRLGVSMPLYSRGEDIDMQLKKVEIMRDRMKLRKTEQELKSQAKALQKELILLSKSKKLKQLNIQKREDLLKFAKLSFSQGRMSEEDYLVYEDKVLSAISSYYETVSQKWQVIAKLAVIYGNDLRGVVR
ncbi:MAG: TolC family protein [Sulfurospirillaceae bacterium]|nr:TolC family protein [Sulfurospirillaceae bacterium]